LCQALGGLLEHVVACGMAQAIVDALEVVEINEQQRELLWFASGQRQQPLELIFEIKADLAMP
jgi:hypothetical protein